MSTQRILKKFDKPQWLREAHKQSKPEEILKIFLKNRDKLVHRLS
jgi:3-phenylpropionate/cinnamic acid dioxygenase small subunit